MHEFLSSRDAAKYIGKSEFTLRWWRTQHLGPPYYRQNRSISYSRLDLDEYLEAHRCGGPILKVEPEPPPPPQAEPEPAPEPSRSRRRRKQSSRQKGSRRRSA
jgi:hypothetical protein